MIEARQTDSNRLFLRGPSPGARVVLLAALSLLLMVLDARHGHLDNLRSALSVAVYPIRALVDLPFTVTETVSENFKHRSELKAENRKLRDDQLLNKVRLQKLAALEAENARLRELMESTAKVADRVLVGEIMAVDLDPYRHRVALNKGVRHGAFEGQAFSYAEHAYGIEFHPEMTLEMLERWCSSETGKPKLQWRGAMAHERQRAGPCCPPVRAARRRAP